LNFKRFFIKLQRPNKKKNQGLTFLLAYIYLKISISPWKGLPFNSLKIRNYSMTLHFTDARRFRLQGRLSSVAGILKKGIALMHPKRFAQKRRSAVSPAAELYMISRQEKMTEEAYGVHFSVENALNYRPAI
jgi:hypothetical protein